jgi:hypothetical protein
MEVAVKIWLSDGATAVIKLTVKIWLSMGPPGCLCDGARSW